jgi:putative Mg2+ transporter-C (MgtC) family protein
VTGGAISYGEVAVRLLIAVALCGLIGFEREARDQAAGLRTHIILGVGATLFTLVSAYGFEDFRAAPGQAEGGATFDPTRIAAQIVSGVGFLGAGAILRYGRDVRGVTTAATLWTVAAIGMAVGAGYLFGAALTTAVVFLTLFVLRKFQRLVMPRLRTDFAVLEIDLGTAARACRGRWGHWNATTSESGPWTRSWKEAGRATPSGCACPRT